MGAVKSPEMSSHQPPSQTPDARPRFYYGWAILLVAALAMVGTLPGRTQGLGLITEPMLRDLHLGRIQYAQFNLWATLIGALFCIGVGQLQDRIGSRPVLALPRVALGLVVLAMSRTSSVVQLFVLITLTRGLGQSALSVASLTMVGQWFPAPAQSGHGGLYRDHEHRLHGRLSVVGSLIVRYGWRLRLGGHRLGASCWSSRPSSCAGPALPGVDRPRGRRHSGRRGDGDVTDCSVCRCSSAGRRKSEAARRLPTWAAPSLSEAPCPPERRDAERGALHSRLLGHGRPQARSTD